MLKHFVLFKFEDGFFGDENYKEYVQAFEIIKEQCSGVKDVKIHRNVVDRPANMDLMIEMDLESEDELGVYLNHEEHVRMGKKYNPHVTDRKSFDYRYEPSK